LFGNGCCLDSDSDGICDVYDINRLEFNDFEKYDLFGFASPVFAFRETTPMRRFIRNIPKMEKFAFVFCTCEGNNGNALYRMYSKLKTKGIKVIAKETFYYPSSYLPWKKKDKKDVVKQSEVDKAIEFGKSIPPLYESIKDAKKFSHISWSFLGAFLGRMSSDFNLRLVLGKIKVDEELCTKCGTCEKMCPTNAIKLDPFPVISNKCTGCVGCINLCPVGALNSSSTKNKPQYKFDPSMIE